MVESDGAVLDIAVNEVAEVRRVDELDVVREHRHQVVILSQGFLQHINRNLSEPCTHGYLVTTVNIMWLHANKFAYTLGC